MSHKLLALGASLLGLSALAVAEPVRAEGSVGPEPQFAPAPRHLRPRSGHAYRPHARMLPPEVRYRDPRVELRPHARPDFLIHAYLPRPTELPMYNEPPQRFPQR